MTVIKPMEVATQAAGSPGGDCIARLGQQDYLPGAETRRFIAVPEGATWAELRTIAGDFETPKVQATPRAALR